MRSAYSIDTLEALRTIAEPHRLEILKLLLGRAQTISMLGTHLDKHPAWVRHHVKALEAAGLVHLAEVRTTRNYTEKFYEATAAAFMVSMSIRAEPGPHSPLVAMVSHDMAVEILATDSFEGQPLGILVSGSLDGLIGVRQGLADIAGCHLLDAQSGEYNTPYVQHIFPDQDMVLVTVAHREQGLMTPSGNPRGIKGIEDIAEGSLWVANRNKGSGTRLWLDRALAALGADTSKIAGYDSSYPTHTQVAEAVASGAADVGLGIAAAANRLGLGFVPLFRERYDLVMSAGTYEKPGTHRLIERLHTSSFKNAVSTIPGYESGCTGDELRLAV